MKRIVVRIVVSLITFALGVTLTRLGLLRHHASIMHVQSDSECSVVYDRARSVGRMRQADDPFLFSAFQQTPVYQMPDCVDEAYSLTWIPSFHPPVLIEVWHSGDKAFIVAKQLDRKWHLAGFPKETNVRALTEFEWREFVN